jgi:uridine kinase
MKELLNIAKSIVEELQSSTRPVLIAISGATCSGKSTLTQLLKEEFEKRNLKVSVVKLDDYMRDWDDSSIKKIDGKPTFDDVLSYDNAGFIADVADLIMGKTIIVPVYDIENNRRLEKTRTIEPHKFIIVEGLFANHLLHGLLYFPRKFIYLDTDETVCLNRRIRRDSTKYNVSAEQVKKVFYRRIWPIYQRWADHEKYFADLVIKNNGQEVR